MKRAVLVFLKLPEVGRVKTRLARGIGDEETLIAYRQMVARVFEQCRNSRCELLAIAFDPADKETEVRSWLAPYLKGFTGKALWIPQIESDLGGRLEAAAGMVFEEEPDLTLSIIGTDCVGLDQGIFEEVSRSLDSGVDVVFGPSEDGGYYLVAMKSLQPCLFRDIPWSVSTTLEASLAAADLAKLKTHLLPSRVDVDTSAEWHQVSALVSQRTCVFFDRDGVVNSSPGEGYVLNAEEFHLNPGIPEALAWLKMNGWLAILVTSQKGVGKKLMTASQLNEIHEKMQRELAKSGANFDGIYAYTGTDECPFPPKPDPGMVLSAAESFFIDLRQSWMIGDADRDIEMGKAAGLAGTIRIKGEKAIGIKADHTLSETGEIINLFEKLL
ncbi:MAG: TIGR04282 family arsenosugar biosynthesis glycosyltransferase [Verrucomicrobiales bacterium]|nr:TIGR04282 family arsenosugar biosynthesis glycosyltransferase [Verrucomicrobiales bacterium]